MASFKEPTLDTLLIARALSREDLKVACLAEDCNKLALKLTRWQELCPFIGLEEQDEEEIDHDYKKHKQKKIGMLRTWREKKGSEATFLCLAEGLESLKWRDMILCLLDLFSDRKQADRESSRVEESKEPGVPRLDDKPRANQILRVKGQSGQEVVIRDQLAGSWEDLLLHLEFEGPESAQAMIEEINSNARGEVEQACREVLLKWLSGHPSKCAPVTWRTLIRVIKKLDCLALANELEQELLP